MRSSSPFGVIGWTVCIPRSLVAMLCVGMLDRRLCLLIRWAAEPHPNRIQAEPEHQIKMFDL